MTTSEMVEYGDGNKFWYLNGSLHRKDGPAVEYVSSTKFWYLNGELHREDGPAVKYASGFKAWFLNGGQLSEKEFNLITMASLPKDLFKI